MVTKGWKTQPIRDFTAQVCKARVPDEADETQSKKGDIVGTAFAVSRKPPLLVTCRHVVEAATESDTCQLNDTVEICFPLAMYSGETITAKVTALDEAHNDDVVILELQTDDGLLPSKAEIAILGDARESIDYEPQHHFKSYGFPEIPDIIGNSAKGIMLDFTASADSDCGFELLQLDTKQVSGGMSGAAVLDTTRNLVVGVISMKLFTDYHQLRDNAYAVESMALTVAPLDLTFHEQWALEKETDPPPRSEVQSPLSYPLKPEFRPTQPPELAEWAGREAMLRALDADWASSATRVVGLIGYGGEGKSSIAYRWLTKYALPSQPDAAFWWSFYEDRSFETMLEALTTYLFGEALATKFKSPSARVEMVGEEIQKKRILLVLDGFEVVQHQQGDQFGEIVSSDLRRLLEIIAQPEHASLCVVTSRAPLIDLLNYDGYTERPVERLSAEDGRTLLRNLSVTGAERAFDTIIKDWDGHALTVSLVGSYLVHTTQTADDYVTEGADKIFPEIEEYEGEVPRYKRVRRVLERYDKHLGKREKAFLKIFSVFRLPVATTAFDTVFRADTGSTLNAPLTELEDSAFANLITGLEKRRLIKRTERDDTTTYSAHPLVQRHYRTALEQSGDDVTPVHKRVAEHYDSTSDEPSRLPTLDDLKPYIEMVHHLCRAGAYDEAFDVTWNRIEQTNSFVLTKKLGADETSLNLMREFFPDNDENKDPQVSQQNIKAGILNEVGVCLMNLGRLREVEPFHIRKIQMALDAKNFQSACI
ncbi:MAG: trypsin-like peptidase domain-containing protein, partial [Chloroflexota bacterium]